MSALLTKIAAGTVAGVGLADIGSAVFVVGKTRPTEDNTGVPAGTVLTEYPGGIVESRSVTISTPGAVIEGYEMGNVRFVLTAPNITFRKCRWDITDNKTALPIISVNHSNASNILIEQCTMLQRDQMGHNHNAIEGYDFVALRCIINGFTDSIRPNLGPNWKIHGCLLGPVGWWGTYEGGPSLNTGLQTHSDCIQTTYGQGEIIGNVLLGYPSEVVGTGTPGNGVDTGNPAGWYTQAQAEARRATSFTKGAPGTRLGGIVTPLMLTRATGPTDLGVVVSDNWFYGGQLHVNGSNANITSLGTFARNRHSLDAFFTAGSSPARAICYKVGAGSNKAIFGTADDANLFTDGAAAIVTA